MTVHEMRQKMPVGEMLTWIAYFNEAAEKKPTMDLSAPDPGQLQRLFG